MPSLNWSPHAIRDVQRLYRFLAAKNPVATRNAITAIRRTVQRLARQPEIGRPDNEEPGLRELVIEFGAAGYVALYRYDPGQAVIILSLRHQREAGYPGPQR